MALVTREQKRYLSITDGAIRERSTEGTIGVAKRVVEMSDGTVKTFWEQVYSSISGRITKMYYATHKVYGTKLNVELTDEGKKYILQFGDSSRYYTDLLSKLPNLDLEEDVTFTPYKIARDNGEGENIGLSVIQGDEKIPSYFKTSSQSPDGTWKSAYRHGYPIYKGKSNDKDRYKLYVQECKIFLKEFTLPIIAKINPAKTIAAINQEEEGYEDDL
jgi:hypothetical protein